MKTFKEYLQERVDDREKDDLDRKKERLKQDTEKKLEALKTLRKRYKDSP